MAISSLNPRPDSCCDLTYDICCLPCTLVSKIWDLVKRIVRFIFCCCESSPFVDENTKKEREEIRNLLRDMTVTQETRVDTPAPSPDPTLLNIGKPVALTTTTPHSNELKKLQIQAKQITTVVASCLLKEFDPKISDTDMLNVIFDTGKMCDALSDAFASWIEQLDTIYPKVFDRLLAYIHQEVKTHIASNDSPEYTTILADTNKYKTIVTEFEEAVAKVWKEHAKENLSKLLVGKYTVTLPDRLPHTLEKYKEAKIYLNDQANKGVEFLLREIWYEEYLRVMDTTEEKENKDPEVEQSFFLGASVLESVALFPPTVPNTPVKKAEEEVKPEIATAKIETESEQTKKIRLAKASATKLRAEKEKEWGKETIQISAQEHKRIYTKLPEQVYESAREQYLQHFYERIFIEKSSCSPAIKNLSRKINHEHKIDRHGTLQMAYRAQIGTIISKILDKLLHSAYQKVWPHLSQESMQWFIQAKFKANPQQLSRLLYKALQIVLKGAAKSKAGFSEYFEELQEVMDINVVEKLIPVLETWISPKLLSEQLSVNILPALQHQLLKTICRLISQNKWSEYAPYFYAYLVLDDKEEVFNSLQGMYWKEMNSDEREVFSIGGPDSSLPVKVFAPAIKDLVQGLEKEHFLAREVLRNMPQTDPENFADIVSQFMVLLQKSATKEQKDQARSLIIRDVIEVANIYATKNHITNDLPKEQKDAMRKKQLLKLANHLLPLVSSLETQLVELRTKVKKKRPWDHEEMSKIMIDLLNDQLAEHVKLGDIVMSIVMDLAKTAPWLNWALQGGPLGWMLPKDVFMPMSVKITLDNACSALIEPYRKSHHELVSTITAKFDDMFTQPGTRCYSKEAVSKTFIEKTPPREDTCDKELEIISQQLFEILELVLPKGAKKFVKATVLGQDHTHAHTIFRKVHRLFFGSSLINLARISNISDIIFGKKEGNVEIKGIFDQLGAQDKQETPVQNDDVDADEGEEDEENEKDQIPTQATSSKMD